MLSFIVEGHCDIQEIDKTISMSKEKPKLQIFMWIWMILLTGRMPNEEKMALARKPSGTSTFNGPVEVPNEAASKAEEKWKEK